MRTPRRPIRPTGAAFTLSLLVACDAALDCPEPTGSGAPGLVFETRRPVDVIAISIDTLRKDAVGRYSGGGDTPFLDELLAESVVLDDFRACSSWTLPGMACAMTGQSTVDLGVEPLALGDSADEKLPDDLETLATALSDAGYQTHLISASWLVTTATALGNGYAKDQFLSGGDAERVTERAMVVADALSRDEELPFFLHIHYRDPHSPYEPPDEYAGDVGELGDLDPRTEAGIREIQDNWHKLSGDEQDELVGVIEQLYAGEVRYTDAMIGELWEALEAMGALEETLVVLWSDHGEQFWEHSSFQHAWAHHGEEGDAIAALWAPTLFANPWDGPTLQQDLVPTVLDALDLPAIEGCTGHVVGTAPSPRTRLAVTVRDGEPASLSAEQGTHRLHYWWDGEASFYDLESDPAETDDIYRRRDRDLRCLWRDLEAEIERIGEDELGKPRGVGP